MGGKVLKGRDVEKRVKVRNSVTSPSVVADKSRILSRCVLDAAEEAKKMIKEAEAEAQRLKEEAQKLLEEAKAEVEAEKKRGFEMGKQEGLAMVTEYAIRLKRLKEDFTKQAEGEIASLVMNIVEKVIGKLVTEYEDVIKGVVRQALESSLGEKIVVRLNPEDYSVVACDEPSFRDVVDRTKRLVFKKDENVARGGCVVETEIGTIDAQMDVQLKAIRKALEL